MKNVTGRARAGNNSSTINCRVLPFGIWPATVYERPSNFQKFCKPIVKHSNLCNWLWWEYLNHKTGNFNQHPPPSQPVYQGTTGSVPPGKTGWWWEGWGGGNPRKDHKVVLEHSEMRSVSLLYIQGRMGRAEFIVSFYPMHTRKL